MIIFHMKADEIIITLRRNLELAGLARSKVHTVGLKSTATGMVEHQT